MQSADMLIYGGLSLMFGGVVADFSASSTAGVIAGGLALLVGGILTAIGTKNAR